VISASPNPADQSPHPPFLLPEVVEPQGFVAVSHLLFPLPFLVPPSLMRIYQLELCCDRTVEVQIKITLPPGIRSMHTLNSAETAASPPAIRISFGADPNNLFFSGLFSSNFVGVVEISPLLTSYVNGGGGSIEPPPSTPHPSLLLPHASTSLALAFQAPVPGISLAPSALAGAQYCLSAEFVVSYTLPYSMRLDRCPGIGPPFPTVAPLADSDLICSGWNPVSDTPPSSSLPISATQDLHIRFFSWFFLVVNVRIPSLFSNPSFAPDSTL